MAPEAGVLDRVLIVPGEKLSGSKHKLYLLCMHAYTYMKLVRISASITQANYDTIQRAINEGRAVSESDAIRIALGLLKNSLDFGVEIRSATMIKREKVNSV